MSLQASSEQLINVGGKRVGGKQGSLYVHKCVCFCERQDREKRRRKIVFACLSARKREAVEPTWRQSERDKQTDRSTKWEAVEERESPTRGHGK